MYINRTSLVLLAWSQNQQQQYNTDDTVSDMSVSFAQFEAVKHSLSNSVNGNGNGKCEVI